MTAPVKFTWVDAVVEFLVIYPVAVFAHAIGWAATGQAIHVSRNTGRNEECIVCGKPDAP